MAGQRTEVAAHPAAQWQQLAFLGGVGALTFALAALLGRSPTYTALAIVGLVTFAIVVYLYRTRQFALWGTGLVVVAILVDWYRIVTVPGFVPVAATMLGLLLLALIFLTQTRAFPWLRVPSLALWIAILLITAIEIPRGGDVTDSAAYYIEVFVNGAIAYTAGVQVVRDVMTLRRLYAGIGVFAIALALHAIVQAVTGSFLLLNASVGDFLVSKSNYTLSGTTTVRVGSFLINPDNLGAFLALSTPLVLGLSATSRSWRARVAWLTGAFLLAIALLFTYSNASWAAFAVSLLVFVFLLGTSRQRIYLVGFLGALSLGLALAFPQKLQVLITHATNPREYALRFAIWRTGINLITANPLAGVGLGPHAYQAHENAYRVSEQDILVGHPHNSFLEIAAAAGLPVLIFVLVIYGGAIWRAARSFREAQRLDRLLIGAGIASVLAFTVNSLATPDLTLRPLVVTDWLILGAVSSPALIAAVRQLARPGGVAHDRGDDATPQEGKLASVATIPAEESSGEPPRHITADLTALPQR
jgi:O-antigen ligase